MKNLLTRIITALFFGLLLIFSVLAGRYSFIIFFGVIALVSLLEFYTLVESGGIRINRVWGMILASLTYLSAGLYQLGYVHLKFFFFLLPFLYIIFIRELFTHNKRPFHTIAHTVLGIVYTVLPFILFSSMAFLNTGSHYDFHPCLGFIFLLWASDTGAYFTGKTIGRHLLMERVSPKKTWEGLLGGLVLSLITSLGLAVFFKQLSLPEWAGMAIIIVFTGTLGDLVESMLKRELDKKDSGNILPGHGGALDRFDGLLIAAPLVFLYLLLLH